MKFKRVIDTGLITGMLVVVLNGYSQKQNTKDYRLKMTVTEIDKHDEHRQLFVINHVPNDIIYKNIPTGFSFSDLRYFSFDPDQMLYERYLAGTLTKESWLNNLKNYNSRMPVLSKTPVTKNNVGIFIGLDQKGNKTIIVDANNNHDFGDDTKYYSDKGTDTVYKLKVSGGYYNGHRIADTLFSMLLTPKQGILFNNDTLHQRLGITFINNSILTTKIKTKNYLYKIGISKPLVPNRGLGDTQLILVTQFDVNGLELNSDFHQLKDSIRIGESTYIFRDIDFNSNILRLTYVGDNKIKGIEVGDGVYNFSAKDIINSKVVSPQLFAGKYILLDFWGTWCQPCIKGIPELIALNNKYKNRLHIISIANDRKQEFDKLKELINVNKMEWSNLWNDYNKGELVNHFKIRAFPTFILIDPNGKIVFKNDGIYSLSAMEKLLR